MDVVDIALKVTEALERCGIGYFLGGSLASSFQGEPRATNDVDLVVDLQEGQVEALAAALGADFDIDDVALSRAAAERSSWNVIYLPSATKIDLFILRASSFDRREFARRRRVEVRAGRAARSRIGNGETWSRCSGSRGRSSTTVTSTNGPSSSAWPTCSRKPRSRPGNRPP